MSNNIKLDNNIIENNIELDDNIIENNIELDNNMVNINYESDIPINVENLKKNLEESKFIIKKDFFIKHLQGKIDKLNFNNKFIDHKYNDYLKSYNIYSISIIIFSSILTLIEAFFELYDIQNIKNFYLKSSIKCLPLLISTFVSIIASLVRFLKFQDHMENLVVTKEKSIIAVSKLKKIREIILFSEDDKKFHDTLKFYITETYENYNDVNIKVSLEISDNDYQLYKNKLDIVIINI